MKSRLYRTLLVILGVASMPAAAGCRQSDQSLQKEVERLKGTVRALERRVAALEHGKDTGLGTAEPFANDWGRPPLEELDKVKLPTGATREEVLSYIQTIRKLSRNQRMFSPSDPQVRMLAQIGPENLEILLDSDYPGFHELEAVKLLAKEEHKRAILDRLIDRPWLVEIVVANGWEADARPLLVAGLERAPDFLPVQWIEAVTREPDPDIYPLLRAYLVTGRNQRMTFEAIKDLPGIQLEDAVREAWERVKKHGSQGDKRQFAHVAVQYGHADALEILIESLEGSRDDIGMWGLNQTLARHTEARGTPAEIRQWYLDNRESLVFDPDKQAFVVP